MPTEKKTRSKKKIHAQVKKTGTKKKAPAKTKTKTPRRVKPAATAKQAKASVQKSMGGRGRALAYPEATQALLSMKPGEEHIMRRPVNVPMEVFGSRVAAMVRYHNQHKPLPEGFRASKRKVDGNLIAVFLSPIKSD